MSLLVRRYRLALAVTKEALAEATLSARAPVHRVEEGREGDMRTTASDGKPEHAARREAARLAALDKRAESAGMLALSFEEAKEARGAAYTAAAARAVAIKATKRKLALV